MSLLVGIVAGALAGGFVANWVDDEPGPAGGRGVASIVEGVEDSVVRIDVQTTTSEGAQEVTSTCVGTGVVLTKDGLIATAAHVVEGRCSIRVTFRDGSEAQATVVGIDPEADVAIVQANATGLKPIRVGSSGQLRAGDGVVVVGYALGLEGAPSVKAGVVSALERSVDAGTSGGLHHLIQTDAAVNDGMSGGPMVDSSGKLVGIVTGRLTLARGISFAVAIDEALPVLERLASRSLE